MFDKGRNYGGYSNAEVDALFEKGRRLFTREERAPIYAEIQKKIYEDQGYLFMYHPNYLLGIDQRFRGVKLSPRGPFLVYPGMAAWWVPAPLRKFN
jgi:ABC-type transport system substrate-binding protein